MKFKDDAEARMAVAVSRVVPGGVYVDLSDKYQGMAVNMTRAEAREVISAIQKVLDSTPEFPEPTGLYAIVVVTYESGFKEPWQRWSAGWARTVEKNCRNWDFVIRRAVAVDVVYEGKACED